MRTTGLLTGVAALLLAGGCGGPAPIALRVRNAGTIPLDQVVLHGPSDPTFHFGDLAAGVTSRPVDEVGDTLCVTPSAVVEGRPATVVMNYMCTRRVPAGPATWTWVLEGTGPGALTLETIDKATP